MLFHLCTWPCSWCSNLHSPGSLQSSGMHGLHSAPLHSGLECTQSLQLFSDSARQSLCSRRCRSCKGCHSGILVALPLPAQSSVLYMIRLCSPTGILRFLILKVNPGLAQLEKHIPKILWFQSGVQRQLLPNFPVTCSKNRILLVNSQCIGNPSATALLTAQIEWSGRGVGAVALFTLHNVRFSASQCG